MIGPFDKSRSSYPELWEGCLRALNPISIYGMTYGVTGVQAKIADYGSNTNCSLICGDGLVANSVNPQVLKGIPCAQIVGFAAEDHIAFPDVGLPSGSSDYSISIWCYVPQIFTGTGVLISYGDARSGGAAAFYKAAMIAVNSSGLYCGVYNSVISYVPWSVMDSKWVHVVYTQKGTTAKCYINGALYLSGTITTPNITLSGTGYIGVMDDVGFRYPYTGYVGTSAIYNRVLSDDEIRLLASDQQIMYEQSRSRITYPLPIEPDPPPVIIKKAKGQGSGCHCCGGCNSPPVDSRIFDIEGSNAAIKSRCCKCTPDYICLSLLETSGSTQTILLDKACDYLSDYDGGSIQYRSDNLWIDNIAQEVNIRLITGTGVADSGCYIAYDIPDIGVSGQTLIDHNISYTGDCNNGMMTEQCVNFTGSWDFSHSGSSYNLSFAKADTISIQDRVCCAGCNCACRCLCVSVWAVGENLTTLYATNDLVCATLTSGGYVENCSGAFVPYRECNTYNWSHPSGYNFTLDGDAMYGELIDYSVCYGDEQETLCLCPTESGWDDITSIKRTIFYPDDFYHVINSGTHPSGLCPPYSGVTSSDPNIEVIYEFDMNRYESDNQVASYFTWLGRSHGIDSTTVFSAYDYISNDWDILYTGQTGRSSGIEYPISIRESLTSVYTQSTGIDKGSVKIRLQSFDSDSLYTDMLRVSPVNVCCKLRLTIPDISGFNYDPNGIEPLNLSGMCPDINGYWFIPSTGGGTISDLTVGISCAWCNETCDSVTTLCCNRALPKILFAEIDLGCLDCPGPCTIPIVSQIGGNLWDMQEDSLPCCTEEQVNSLSFACGGSGFTLSLQINACTFVGSLSSSSCSPLNVAFTGIMTGGIGCCGSPGEELTSPNVTITIVE